MCPDGSGHDGDYNTNGKENKGKMISSKENINLLTKRSVEIRSKIQDLTNSFPLLSELNRKLQSESAVTDKKQEGCESEVEKDVFYYNLTIKNDDNTPKTKIFDINKRLVDLNHELANVNDEIITSLVNLNEKYEKQQEFINIAAHEIRSPCQSIIGYVELLNLEPVNSKRYLNLITRNAERLNLLISNILDASRIDNRTLILKKEKVDLVKLIEHIIDDINNRNTNKKSKNSRVIFENILLSELDREANDIKEEDRTIITDVDIGRISQVMFNLLDNAIRFSKGSKIIISLKKINSILNKRIEKVSRIESNEYSRSYEQKQDHGEIIVQVKDSGKGINSEVSDNLFSKFTSDLTSGGTGLGLFISKNIIEAHGGRIWAENNKNEKGATFSFSLPL
jgi:signal transduction histidine kinase